MTDLVPLAERVGPWAVLVLLLGAAGWRALDKLTTSNGPVTRLLDWVAERELRSLRRQGVEEEERRKLARDAESETVTWLRDHVKKLEEHVRKQAAEIDWLRRQAADAYRRERHYADYLRAVSVWQAENLPRWHAGQPPISDPPLFQPLAPLLFAEDLAVESPPP